MSSTPIQDPGVQGLSSGSGQTLPSRPLQPISDPSASKRVCFYKSGDYQFSGHRMVINARTFKTFDALLDALSKKVPLPFGVRTITTPRGTHLVKGLDDLQDGGSYVCSDRKRVKPLNLNEVKRRQVPWNTTRPVSAGRRRRRGFRFGQIGSRNEARPAKVTDRVAVRTPKRLVVIKNRDPTVKRTIVLQRRTAPTFDSLLDYLSQILQFPVLKLYSTDGRRVDGLAALILCSGVVVAAGSEPFRLGNYSFHRTGQMAQVMYMETVEPSMLLPRAQNTKSFSSGRGSRNFSSSSERYIVNQINKSRNGSTNSHVQQHDGSTETEVNQCHTFMETCETGREDDEQQASIVPQDDDIEKSFRVNQDGSMTVEMKVRLTIKEEEMLHWTTTLSRSSLSKGTACASISESGNSSPDSNNAIAKDSSSISEDETKEENHPTGAGKGVGLNDEQLYEGYASTALGKAKTSFKRTPTPGPRHIKKKASIESVKTVTETGVQESTVGHYSYMERTADGETTEGYCVVRHSSSSNRPIPKPRKTASAETSKKGSHSSIRSSGVAEVLQIQNNGMEVTETVMHIYESQGCYDNYLANNEYSADGVPLEGSTPVAESKPSTEPGSGSSSNDCDIDFSCQPSTADPLQRQGEEMLSLSSEPMSPAHEVVKKDKNPKSKKSSTSRSSSDKKLNENISINPSKTSKHSSTDRLSNVSMGKKSLSSTESAKSGQKRKGTEKKAGKSQSEKSIKDELTPKKDSALLGSSESVKKNPPKRQSTNKVSAKDKGHNVNTPTARPQMKKNMSDLLQPKKSLLPGRKTMSKPKSMTENQTSSPRNVLELSESVSMPSLNPTPSDVHQYVENWLETVSQDQVPYTESLPDESEPRSKVVFKIGGDSESDEMSESQNNLDEYYLSGDTIKKSTSCLSVPLYHEGPTTTVPYNEHKTKGLCVSMPSVRVDPVPQESTLRAHKSAEAISPHEDASTSSNTLSPKGKIKPVLRQLCSSIQCIRRPSETNTPSNLEKSASLPDFSTQVASVFGSSCKAFLSFLSVMTLRDSITDPGLGDSYQSRSTSEAMLMMESLQKISTIEDEEEQRASLTDLQSRASSDFRERWKDFQIMRERLESEPLSPKVSETEFALDVVSEGGDVFEDHHQDIDELLEELNMPQDIRAEISSTIQHTRSFYPLEESTFVETDRNQSETEDDVEKFVDECNDETKQSTATCADEKITEKERKEDNDNVDVGDLNEMQSMFSENVTMTRESQQEADEIEEKGSDVSQRGDEALEVKDETEEREDEDQIEGDRGEDGEGEKDREDRVKKEINGDVKELENMEEETQEEKDKAATEENDEGQEEYEAEKGTGGESVAIVEEGTAEDVPADERKKLEEGETDTVEETEEGLVHEEEREDDCAEETDEREMAEETLEDETGRDEHAVEEEAADEEKVDEEEVVLETDENLEDKEDKEVAESNAEEEVEEVIEEAQDEEEVEKTSEADEKEIDVVSENDVEEDKKDTTIGEEGEEEEKEEVDEVTENNIEETVEDNDEKDEVEDFNDEMEEKDVDLVIDNDEEEKEEEKEGNNNEKEKKDEEEVDMVTEDDVEEDVEEVIKDTDEEREVGEEVVNLNGEMEEKEEEDEVMENDGGEDVEKVIGETDGEGKEETDVENFNDEKEETEKEEVDVIIESNEEEQVENISGEEENVNNEGEEKEEEEEDRITEKDVEEDADTINEKDEEEETENLSEGEEEEEEEVDADDEEKEEEEEEENMNDEVQEQEEKEDDVITDKDVEEDTEKINEKDEEDEAENLSEGEEEEEEGVDADDEEKEEENLNNEVQEKEEEEEDAITEKGVEEEEADEITEEDEEEAENLSEGGEEEEGLDADDEEKEEEEEEENMNDEEKEQEEKEDDVITDKDVEEDAEKITEKDEEEETENLSGGEEEEEEGVDADDEEKEEKEEENLNNEVQEEEDAITEKDVEEADEITEKDEEEAENPREGGEEEEGIDAADEEEEEENMNDEVQEQEEEEDNAITDKDVEEDAEKITEKDEEEEAENLSEGEEEEEEETAVVDIEKDEEEFKMELVSVSGDDDDDDDDDEDDDDDIEGKNTEDRRAEVITDDEEEKSDKDTEEEDKGDEGNREALENIEDSPEERSVEADEAEELKMEENMKAGQTDEEEMDDDEENELNKELHQVEKQKSVDEVEEGNDDEDEDSDEDVDSSVEHEGGENLLEEALYLQQHCSTDDETNVEHNTESPIKCSSEGQCEFDKGNGTDTADDLEIDDAGEYDEERSNSLQHPAEISQELLDFVNSILQSSSLIFTYDTQGKIRIEPENARVVQTKLTAIPKRREDTSYGLKRLPSPSTSDLTDYRPETSESGGYKSQESVDVVTESGEEATEKPFPVYRRKTHIPKGTSSAERAASKASVASNSEILQSSRLKSPESFSSFESGTKASREDLSYFSATSSLKGDAEAAPGATQYVSFTSGMDTGDGILIDRGRWLLKENHLIRKSPPVSLGMYGNLDSTSIDTGQENTSEDSPPHYKTQNNPLAAISSSELEEMAKPQTPKCTYYNMPHGSDSDPFLDDSSTHSQKKDTSSVKGRGVKVSPTIDTSKTWSNKNGSLSSFTSVEFKISDRKVHPEGESSAVTQARRPPSGRVHALQAQDSLDAMRMRCGQYCPIL